MHNLGELLKYLHSKRERRYRAKLSRYLQDHLYAAFWEDTGHEWLAEYFQKKVGISTPERALSAIESAINRKLAIMHRHGFEYRDLLGKHPLNFRYELPYIPNPPHLRVVK